MPKIVNYRPIAPYREDPPQHPTAVWADTFAMLRANPGQWYVVAEGRTAKSPVLFFRKAGFTTKVAGHKLYAKYEPVTGTPG